MRTWWYLLRSTRMRSFIPGNRVLNARSVPAEPFGRSPPPYPSSSPPSARAALCSSSSVRASTPVSCDAQASCAHAREATPASDAVSRSLPRCRRDNGETDRSVITNFSSSELVSLRQTSGRDLSMEDLTGQKRRKRALSFDQGAKTNSSVEPHRLQHEYEVLGRDVAARAGA